MKTETNFSGPFVPRIRGFLTNTWRNQEEWTVLCNGCNLQGDQICSLELNDVLCGCVCKAWGSPHCEPVEAEEGDESDEQVDQQVWIGLQHLDEPHVVPDLRLLLHGQQLFRQAVHFTLYTCYVMLSCLHLIVGMDIIKLHCKGHVETRQGFRFSRSTYMSRMAGERIHAPLLYRVKLYPDNLKEE